MTRKPLGSAIRERQGRGRSGPNIPDSQRHTVRIRVSRLSHALATKLAGERGSTMAGVIEELLEVAAAHDQKDRR